MSIKSRIRQWIFNHHILIEKLNSGNDIKFFLERFRNKYVSSKLVRIGGEGDGGYLLPDKLNKINYCFSPGVDYTANFESELSKIYDIKSFMADASVKSPPVSDKNFEFIPKFLGSRTHGSFITLSDWIEQSIGNENYNCILQMDIESSEYDVLIYESADILAKFSYMIIEFHNLQNLFEKNFLRLFSSIFEKIYLNFSICHVHPNNCCGIAELDGIKIPRVVEVTFIRNDLIDDPSCSDKISLPHVLDRKNIEENDDIMMPEIWWKKE